MFKTEKFETWIKNSGYLKGYIADKLGCTRQGFIYKVKHGTFTFEEIAILIKMGLTADDITNICK